MVELILFSSLVVFIYMTIWWLYSVIVKRNDVADVAWGLGFIAIAISLYLNLDSPNMIHSIALILVSIWGLRLAIHIGLRHRNNREDGRYQEMKKGWKYPKIQSYLNVFLTQGFFMLLVATPIMLLFNSEKNINVLNLIGILVWIIGFLFEAIGDYQLKNFISNPNNKGKIMRYGLWKYTRHPNYFGEISLWWGFYLIILFTDYWYFGLIGPITISFLIIGVSGIPMLEKRYKGNKEYEEYQRNTNAFFPGKPKT